MKKLEDLLEGINNSKAIRVYEILFIIFIITVFIAAFSSYFFSWPYPYPTQHDYIPPKGGYGTFMGIIRGE
jgi:hypothetical protein